MPNRSNRARLWSSLLGLAVSAGLLFLIVRQVDLRQVREHLAGARALPLAAAVALATATFPLRAIRWRLLLRAAGGGPLPWPALWHATALGFMANNVLPFRAGELVRPFAVTRLAGARFSAALSSIAVERIFDALTIAFLLGLALLGTGLAPGAAVGGVSLRHATLVAGALALAGLLVALLVVTQPLAAERAIRRLFPPGRLADRLVSLIEGVRHGLAVLNSPARVAGVAAWSVALWLVNALSFYVAFAAFDIRVGYAGALVLQGLLVLGVAVPSTPGYLGPFEAAIVAALALYGVPSASGFSYAIAYHVTTFIPITLLGLWSLARTPVGLGDLRRSAVS